MESKFIALESVGNKADWLKNFLIELPLGIKPTHSISMHCDCQTAITIAKNKSFNGKNWHIRLRHDVIKQLLKDRIISIYYVKSIMIISIDYVKSVMNLADLLTKSLGRKMISETSWGMRLIPTWEIKNDGKPTYVIGDPMN